MRCGLPESPHGLEKKKKSWIALPTIAMHLIVQAVCSAPMPPW
jgi:hypothetical protein